MPKSVQGLGRCSKYQNKPQSILTLSEILTKLMPYPGLLPGEHADQFEAFYQSFVDATNPIDIIEHVLVLDIAYYTWEAARCWRIEVLTIKAARREAVEKDLFPFLFGGQRGCIESTRLTRLLA